MRNFHLFQFADYQKYIRNECLSENPMMERSIALCNGISQWVQLMVLSRPTPQLRAEVFTKFIYVAQVFQQPHVPTPPSLNTSDQLIIVVKLKPRANIPANHRLLIISMLTMWEKISGDPIFVHNVNVHMRSWYTLGTYTARAKPTSLATVHQ